MATLRVSVFTVPTEAPESDATLEWDSVTLVLAEVEAGGRRGLGYTYGPQAVGRFIEEQLAGPVADADVLSPPRTWVAMQEAIRNAGQAGVGAMAISAVDVALWDLKARLLGVCLADALPRVHGRVPVYGSGGFTSLSLPDLQEQLARWAPFGRVKMKVGRAPERDPERLAAAREAIGRHTELFVDANGAFERKEALRWAARYAEHGVTYFEEPVTSGDVAGLRLLRDRTGLDVAAGEYAWGLGDVQRLLDAVDVMQADVTRVGGITGLLGVDGLCTARALPFSAHGAPSISAHVCCAMESAAHVEYFHDHVRVERLLFDGTLAPTDGSLEPDRSRPGLGLELKRPEAERFAA
jgi:L-alanine-DL-glutamate epimerase-like enolase superfamily enzyme